VVDELSPRCHPVTRAALPPARQSARRRPRIPGGARRTAERDAARSEL